MRGRPKTPQKLLEMRGSKYAKGKQEPRAPRGAPSCPAFLSTEAKAEWKRIIPQLENMGILSEIDRAAIACYCQSWADFVKYAKLKEEQGETFVTPQGYRAKNPVCTLYNEARDAVLKFSSQFGLTPSSRSRIQIVEEQKDDEILKLIGG